jgi:hypothetical protein
MIALELLHLFSRSSVSLMVTCEQDSGVQCPDGHRQTFFSTTFHCSQTDQTTALWERHNASYAIGGFLCQCFGSVTLGISLPCIQPRSVVRG